MKKAFTLIELLVVIAIIAILAAILFPVFAQAKAAAKATVALSNVKQTVTGEMMYMNDFDDRIPLQYYNIPGFQLEWKEAIYPYTKNADIFRDPQNPAAKYYDAETDPALVIYYGINATGDVPNNHRYARGYAMTNLFYVNHAWDMNGFSPSTYEQPASLMSIVEWKLAYVAAGPNFDWVKDRKDDDGTLRGGGWSWGGGKWGDAAQVVGFFDGHAKRTSNHAMCGKDNELNYWGYQRDQLNVSGAYIPGATLPWLDTFCQTIPQGL